MIKLFTHTNCNSSKRAKQWLIDHQLKFNENKTNKLTRTQIVEIMSRTERGVEDVLCVRSNIFKSLNINLSNITMNQLFKMIEKYPALVKYPIIMDERCLYVGFNEDEYRAFLPREFRITDLQLKRKGIQVRQSFKQ